MLAGLPKLFDRSFFIGYFLPSFLLFGGVGTNLFAFGYIDNNFTDLIVTKNTLGAVISVVLVWLLSILLMTFSRSIVRLLEGYGQEANPFHIFLPQQRQLFKSVAEPHLRKVDSVLNDRRKGIPQTQEFEKLDVWRATVDFPEDLDLVLPTRLGNVMRAYERYSNVVYGIEAIVVWPRLAMVIPEEARERIREAEALFYFSINMLVVGLITISTCATLAIRSLYSKGTSGAADVVTWPIVLIVLVSVFFICFSWLRLPHAARERGDQVKSTFDLYRKPLAEALGFELPPTEAEERKMWELVSRRMLLRVSEDRLRGCDKTLDDFRKRDNNSYAKDSEKGRENPKTKMEGETKEEHENDAE